MPRNGSGVMSKPANSTAQPNTVIKSAMFNGVVDDLIADANFPRPVSAGGTGGATQSAAQDGLGVDGKIIYTVRTAAYTAVKADNNGASRFTATATLGLTAAGTLGPNWHHTVYADGAAVTIDPNGVETINGASTLVIPNGSSARIYCDGGAFWADYVPRLSTALLQDQKPSGTAGGVNVTGWQTRTLNTEVFDADNIVTIASNQFTPAFDCMCEFEVPGYAVGFIRARIYNVTDAVVAFSGSNAFSPSGAVNTDGKSRGIGKVIAGKTYRLEMYAAVVQTANGLGVAATTGEPEIYSSVTLRRI